MSGKYTDASYEIGKGKPPVDMRFKPGQSGNPGGKSSAQRKREVANAETATKIRGRMLRALEKSINDAGDAQIVGMIEAAMMTMLKDSENRGLGLPKAAVEHSSPDGTMTPTVIRIMGPEEGDK